MNNGQCRRGWYAQVEKYHQRNTKKNMLSGFVEIKWTNRRNDGNDDSEQ